jgi:hypothetical protein
LFCSFSDLEDPKVLLDLISSGQLEIIHHEQQGEIDSADNSSSVTWSASVESVFELPTPAAASEKKVNRKKITSHRLLTSDEIYEQKTQEKENKIRQEFEKEQRKIAREMKRKNKMEHQQKRPKKQNTNKK